jgi:hypothetical protein
MKNKIQEFITQAKADLDKGLVATPKTRKELESFAKANQGSMDILLMQMSINYGYKIAVDNLFTSVLEEINRPDFVAKDIEQAFEMCKKQEHTLSAYEGALLMFNTIDKLID